MTSQWKTAAILSCVYFIQEVIATEVFHHAQGEDAVFMQIFKSLKFISFYKIIHKIKPVKIELRKCWTCDIQKVYVMWNTVQARYQYNYATLWSINTIKLWYITSGLMKPVKNLKAKEQVLMFYHLKTRRCVNTVHL